MLASNKLVSTRSTPPRTMCFSVSVLKSCPEKHIFLFRIVDDLVNRLDRVVEDFIGFFIYFL